MKLLAKLIFFTSILVVVIGYGAYVKLNQEVEKNIAITTATTFTIESGQSFKKITQSLQQAGIIKNSLWIYWYSRLNKISHKLKAGEYIIPANISSVALVQIFIKGKAKQYTFTIIEGWSFKELKLNIIKNKDLVDDVNVLSNKEIMLLMGNKMLHPEGQFLPETYAFTKGAKASSILKRAHNDLNNFIKTAWEKRIKPTPIKTPYEALILASIVEKETGVAEERPLIAGVFINRLNIKMKLQTDPTVIYVMGDKYKGDIRFRDLRNYTPYNTYRIKALPPTPIAMAGRAAIEAALQPEKTKALYFVAMGKGKHLFSSTLKDHNNAVNKYQRKRNAL
jgi:UPF0755 protein